MDSDYQLVIVAGGEGKRISHITKGRPKCLLEIERKTLLDYCIELYPTVNDIILLLGYCAEEVKKYVENKKMEPPYVSKTIKYSIEEKLLGKGGAIRNALENEVIDRKKGYIIHYPDDLVLEGKDFGNKLISQHEKNKERGYLVTIVVVEEVEYPFGRVKLENGCVVGFEEKPWVPVMTNIGVYVLEPEVNEFIKKYEPPFDFESKILKELCEKRKAGIMVIDKENWISINDEKGLKKAEERIKHSWHELS